MEETAMVEPTTGERLRALQRAEASARLRILEGMGLDPSARKAFDEEGRISFDGAVDSVFGVVRLKCLMQEGFPSSRAGDPLMRSVKAFEEKFGALVFFATHEFLPFGEVLDLFYVSPDAEEWEDDRAMLSERRAYVKACNLDDGMMSDIGVICFEVSEGGLVRTA